MIPLDRIHTGAFVPAPRVRQVSAIELADFLPEGREQAIASAVFASGRLLRMTENLIGDLEPRLSHSELAYVLTAPCWYGRPKALLRWWAVDMFQALEETPELRVLYAAARERAVGRLSAEALAGLRDSRYWSSRTWFAGKDPTWAAHVALLDDFEAGIARLAFLLLGGPVEASAEPRLLPGWGAASLSSVAAITGPLS